MRYKRGTASAYGGKFKAQPPNLRYQVEPGNESNNTVNSQQSTVNSQQSFYSCDRTSRQFCLNLL
ncbi:hypothetical protein QUB56_10100 [Microcoleus sp. AR_TQ3_B6]|uniref:hypothetical protein n=1 Tax=Microcoleus sp. AR_TQ3_B6 TaxID=3055284 RepID=UPI002FD5C597